LPSRSKSPSRSLPDFPDLPRAIVGWRVWRVDPSYRLLSTLRDEVWEPGRSLAASCESRHPAPDPACTCGVYAVRRPEQAQAYLVGRNNPEAVHRVLGQVALWGCVVECEQGWRAERAYPARLWVPDCPEAFEIAFGLGRYGVPVEVVAARRSADIVLAALAA
jgi:hypothetical protein